VREKKSEREKEIARKRVREKKISVRKRNKVRR
jgi:hypothetical protein